jgi:hypothetical protein
MRTREAQEIIDEFVRNVLDTEGIMDMPTSGLIGGEEYRQIRQTLLKKANRKERKGCAV